MNEKRQLTNANTKLIHILGLSDKELEAAIIQSLQKTITNMFEINEKIESLRKK